MNTYRKTMYPNYLKRLEEIRKEIASGKEYYKNTALNDYYVMLGALTLLLHSEKINCDKFGELSDEAWSAYMQCVKPEQIEIQTQGKEITWKQSESLEKLTA